MKKYQLNTLAAALMATVLCTNGYASSAQTTVEYHATIQVPTLTMALLKDGSPVSDIPYGDVMMSELRNGVTIGNNQSRYYISLSPGLIYC